MFANPGDFVKLKYKKNNGEIVYGTIIYMYFYENEYDIKLFRMTPNYGMFIIPELICKKYVVSFVPVTRDGVLKILTKKVKDYSLDEINLILSEIQKIIYYNFDCRCGFYNCNNDLFSSVGFGLFRGWRSYIHNPNNVNLEFLEYVGKKGRDYKAYLA